MKAYTATVLRAVITRSALALAAMLTLPGCSGEAGTGPSAAKSQGLYELETVDQAAPPAIIHKGPWLDKVNTRFYNVMVMTVTGGTIELEDGWFYMSFDLQFNADGNRGNSGIELEGTWKQFGDKIDFTPEGQTNAAWSATIRNGVITLPLDMMGKGVNASYAFRR